MSIYYNSLHITENIPVPKELKVPYCCFKPLKDTEGLLMLLKLLSIFHNPAPYQKYLVIFLHHKTVLIKNTSTESV